MATGTVRLVRLGDQSPETIASIGTAAGRIRRYGEAIRQAHTFGIEPGSHTDLTSLPYHRAAVPVYCETIPWTYLVNLASSFGQIAHPMSTVRPAGSDTEAWKSIYNYLRSATTALTEAAPIDSGPVEADHAPTIDPITPPVMRFGNLAGLAAESATLDLVAKARLVEAACGGDDPCPLNEQEKNWLRRFIAGDPVIDVALDDGYSERSLYRALSELWRRLGVSGRTSAIALALENNWLD